MFIPALAELFKLTMLSSVQWIITLIISIIPVIVMECQKKFNEIKFGKIVYSYEKKLKNIIFVICYQNSFF